MGFLLNRWGFHADPTMAQLHMHVVSDDFRGFGLKTAKHWNSFTTSFFIPLSSKACFSLW